MGCGGGGALTQAQWENRDASQLAAEPTLSSHAQILGQEGDLWLQREPTLQFSHVSTQNTGEFATQPCSHLPWHSAIPGRWHLHCDAAASPLLSHRLLLCNSLHSLLLHSSMFLKELFKNLQARLGLWDEHGLPGLSLLPSGRHQKRLCSGVIPWRNSCKTPVSSHPPVPCSPMPHPSRSSSRAQHP